MRCVRFEIRANDARTQVGSFAPLLEQVARERHDLPVSIRSIEEHVPPTANLSVHGSSAKRLTSAQSVRSGAASNEAFVQETLSLEALKAGHLDSVQKSLCYGSLDALNIS